MGDLSVTLKQKSESLLVGGLFLLIALICGTIACCEGESVGIAVAVLCVLCSGFFFLRTGNQQTLDATGIHVKNYFGERQYSWELVEKTRIIKISYKDLPYIQFFIRGHKKTILVYYTKRTSECLRCYYGEPDDVRVKEPPVNI